MIVEEARPRSRRDWVKNALIIFLSLLLVLTFFSNTIMNWSLPEVAAQYPQSTSLTTKIRGSGMVEAAQTYQISVHETRTVASVNVKEGDTVKGGAVLLTLEETESQELTAARDALSALQLEYDKMLVERGDQSHADSASLQQLRDAVSSAQNDLANARQYESNLSSYQKQVASAQSNLNSKTQAKADADNKIASLTSQIELVEGSNADYLRAKERAANYPEDEEARAEVQRIYDEQIAPKIASLNQQLASAQNAADSAASAVSSSQAALDSAQSALSNYESSSSATSVSAAQAALDAANDALSSALAAAEDAAAQKAYDDTIAQLDLDAKTKELQEAEEQVKKLEAQAGPVNVTSPYSGTVQSVSIAAGATTEPDSVLMVIELTGKGYTLTSSVSKQQARSLREGMTAEVTNLWNSDIQMTLTSIKADQNNPAATRVLTFSVQGDDVSMGQQLSFSIGDQNASYDVVIPTASIHSDADGSFVYTIQTKFTPLGNRYTVRKTEVEIIASDDTQSAVAGALSTADFVITTATVPLEAGDQVRIAE